MRSLKTLVPEAIRRPLWPAYYFAQAAARARGIRRFDRRVSRSAELWSLGFKRYPVMPTDLVERARALLGTRAVRVDETVFPIVEHLVGRVRADVVAYLGHRARVDNISVSHVAAGTNRQNVSGSWHEDGVGHRLKLFFCIEGSGDVPTALLPGTNQRPYFPRFGDFHRFRGVADTADEVQQVLVDHKTGDCTLFDTNTRHRGVYNHEHRPRTVLEIEFADRDKSDRYRSRIAIGPGNSGAPRFAIAKRYASTAEDLLLDTSLFREHEDPAFYAYG